MIKESEFDKQESLVEEIVDNYLEEQSEDIDNEDPDFRFALRDAMAYAIFHALSTVQRGRAVWGLPKDYKEKMPIENCSCCSTPELGEDEEDEDEWENDHCEKCECPECARIVIDKRHFSIQEIVDDAEAILYEDPECPHCGSKMSEHEESEDEDPDEDEDEFSFSAPRVVH